MMAGPRWLEHDGLAQPAEMALSGDALADISLAVWTIAGLRLI